MLKFIMGLLIVFDLGFVLGALWGGLGNDK